ncbi:MAG: hypothetical protein LBC25_01855 [Holosporales bacterium]|nr:hypothetical protein [Holosporales bacterium]
MRDRIAELGDSEAVLLDPVSAKLAEEIMTIRRREIKDHGALPLKLKHFLRDGGQYLIRARSSPETLNEKVLNACNMFYVASEVQSWFCNKLTAKLFVRDRVGEKYVARLYGAFKNLNEVFEPEFWNRLPQKFVVKGVLGSYGESVLVIDKRDPETMKHLTAMEGSMASRLTEERFIVEEFLTPMNQGRTVTDYKFLCSYGKIIWVIVGDAPDKPGHIASDRDKWQAIYTVPGWNRLEAQYGHKNPIGSIEKPPKLSEMMEIAQKLSRDFPIIRIDLYLTKEENGRLTIKVGEMTRRSCRGRIVIKPVIFDLLAGALAHSLTEEEAEILLNKHLLAIKNWRDELQQSHNLMRGIVMPGFDFVPHINFDSWSDESVERLKVFQGHDSPLK